MTAFREEEGRALLRKLNEHPDTSMSIDTEGTGLNVWLPGCDFVIGISIAGLFEDGTPFKHYFPVAHETGENVSEETRQMLMYVMTEPGRKLIFCNAPYDIQSISTMNCDLLQSDFVDIGNMAHYINENWPARKGLEDLAQCYLGEEGKIVDEFVETEKVSGNRNITPEQMWDYAVLDAVSTFRIWDVLDQHPEWLRLPETLWPEKQDLIRVIIEMKRRGIEIDQEVCREMVAVGEQRQKDLARELGYPAVPKKPTKMYPNPDPDPMPTLGPLALKDLFIDRLGMEPMNVSEKTGKPSFAKDVMEEYDIILDRLDSPEAKLVKAYRGWQKTTSAAYRPYLELVDHDGRLRCEYRTTTTVTGRLSCVKPNLQQVPKSTDKEWNGKVKEAFVAREGYTLINADFSQLELRLATAYAGEQGLKQVFEEGRDIFDEMSGDLGFSRGDTKTFVYSTQYGAGEKRIMNAFGVSKDRAKQMINTYKNTYPMFARLNDRVMARAEAKLEVRIWTGRYRHFKYKNESYKAMNSVIQGGAADLMERCMVHCFKTLDNPDCQMLLQVHDSITWEVKTELVEHYMPLIKSTMEDVNTYVGHNEFDVKFAVEVEFWTEREERIYNERMGVAA